MKFVIQRVKEAEVKVDGQTTGKIDDGFLVLIHCVKLILIQIEWLLKNIFMMRINQNISHIEILQK